jgi:hypothetical protein
MKTAIKPDTFHNIITKVKAEEKKVSEEEQSLYGLSQQHGWKILKEFIEDSITSLDSANEMAISKGLSFEEIGKNTVVISLAKSKIKAIIDKVNDAVEAVENEQ